MNKNFWIRSAGFDSIWFLAPLFLPSMIIWFLPNAFLEQQRTEIFPWSWIFLVLAIDVAHVYSTVYKTYFHPQGKVIHRFKLLLFPIVVWIVGILIHSLNSRLFWSVLTYFAVFHFVRQQYGFFRLYAIRSESGGRTERFLLNQAIYCASLIPILIWHFSGKRNFNWMTDYDFVYYKISWVGPALHGVLLLSATVYCWMEYRQRKRNGKWNVPRMLLTLGTGISYYTGIVLTNNDFSFTFINVLGHGIPYMALIWHSEKKTQTYTASSFLKMIFSRWGWLLFYIIIFLMAYFEESLWDVLVWRQNETAFGWFYHLTQSVQSTEILNILVPLLIMPQVVHYILDAYIWRKKENEHFMHSKN